VEFGYLGVTVVGTVNTAHP